MHSLLQPQCMQGEKERLFFCSQSSRRTHAHIHQTMLLCSTMKAHGLFSRVLSCKRGKHGSADACSESSDLSPVVYSRLPLVVISGRLIERHSAS